MQDLPSLTLRELLAIILTSTSLGGAVGAFFQWLLQRKKSASEAVHITAQSVKIEAEARQVSTRTIIEAQERIVEQVDLIARLNDELVEANRRSDNFEFDLKQAKLTIDNMKVETKLARDFIKQLKAANILKIELKDTPSADKLNADGTLKDVRET